MRGVTVRSSSQSLPNLNIGFGTTAPGAVGGGCLTTLCATTELVNLDGTNKWPENFLMLPACKQKLAACYAAVLGYYVPRRGMKSSDPIMYMRY